MFFREKTYFVIEKRTTLGLGGGEPVLGGRGPLSFHSIFGRVNETLLRVERAQQYLSEPSGCNVRSIGARLGQQKGIFEKKRNHAERSEMKRRHGLNYQ